MKQVLQRVAMEGRVDVVAVPDDSKVWSLIKALQSKKHSNISPINRLIKPIVALDPGETTGIAVWDPSSKVILLAQLDTQEVGEGFDSIAHVINYLAADRPSLEHVRYEDYRVYGHMTETHAFSDLHTARVIGAIEVACHLAQVPWTKCLAMHAKTFWTDEKLKMCNVYNRGMRHARDAERHLLRYMGE